MKKFFILIFTLIILIGFTACDSRNLTTDVSTDTSNTTTEALSQFQDINLYSINDFHGGTYTDIENLSDIGYFLKYQKENNDNAIVLANGDIFQGTALSNYYYGLPIVDTMNNIGFDGFIIGNHEFDWGIDEVLKYKDGNLDNGEMTYPILAANIVYEDTQETLENTIPYITQEINNVKVGIIGLIGDVINSISASRTENIEFLDPADTVYDYAEELRTEEDCDIVVVYIHEGSDINSEIASFTGDHYVDAVFNGHTHREEASSISRSEGFPLLYAQASNGSDALFAQITLRYDNVNEEVVSGSASVITEALLSGMIDFDILSIIDSYSNDTEYRTFVNEYLTDIASNYYRDDLAVWGASVIRDYAGVDIGAINSGGFRNTMYSGILTMGDLIEIYPFDNYIKTSEMTGLQILNFYEDVIQGDEDVVFDDHITYDGDTLYIGGNAVVLSQTYVVGAVDYIFDKTYYDFLNGENITQTTMLIRDLIVQDLQNETAVFDPSDGTNYPS